VRSNERSRNRPPRFFSVAQVAEILGVSEVTIYREIGAGEFPAVKIRGRYVVPAKALDQLEADALARFTAGDHDPDTDTWGVA
jgi:excisionase family DNA binding protein